MVLGYAFCQFPVMADRALSLRFRSMYHPGGRPTLAGVAQITRRLCRDVLHRFEGRYAAFAAIMTSAALTGGSGEEAPDVAFFTCQILMRPG